MKKNITSLFFCLSLSTAVAQTTGNKRSTLPNIKPPSSESYKLGAFGNIPVSLFTGNANVDIPITSFQTKNISLPIKLNYFSNGIKVDDMNGSAGLGWNLISAGVITRVIRDLPDEDHLTNISFPTDVDSMGGTRSPAAMQFFQDASNDNVDTEQDLYMASFGGMQIKFVFDKRGMPVVYSQKDVIIEGRSGGPSFTITTDDGMKFYFTDKESTANRTSGNGHSLISISTTAWYLTKIEDVSTGETVFIENVDGGYTTTISQSQTLSYTEPKYGPMHSSCGNPAYILYPVESELMNHNQHVTGKQIKRIYSNNPVYGDIVFDYLQSGNGEDYKPLQKVTKKVNNTLVNNVVLNYNLTGNNRLFLTSVVDNVLNTTYGLEYNQPDKFPKRLAFSRDGWGYHNGSTGNTNLVPRIDKVVSWSSYNGASTYVSPDFTAIGILKKIVYPTKGSTEFFYENHTKVQKNVVITPEQKTGVQIGAEKGSSGPQGTAQVTFTPVKDEEITIGGGAWFNSNACEKEYEVAGKHRATTNLRDANGNLITLYQKTPGGMATAETTSLTLPAPYAYYAMVSKNQPLTLSLRTLFLCVQSEAAATYTKQLEVRGDREVAIGGLRISKIVDYTENGVATTRKFVYHDVNEQTSEAIVLKMPEFEESVKFTRTCYKKPPAGSTGEPVPIGVERFPYYTVTSTNINQLYATHPNVFYKTVQEIVEGKSTIIHNYSTDVDDYGKVLYGENIRNSTWTNFGWNNGREISTKYLDANNKLVRTAEMNYEEDQSRKYQVDGFSIRKNYDNPLAKNVTYTCTAEDVTRTFSATMCTTNHSHYYITTDGYKNCYAIGANNVTTVYKDICFGQQPGTVLTFADQLDNLDIVQYKNISHFEYLKSQKTTDYVDGTAMKTETQYFYDNPKHTQLTSQKTIFPDLSSTLNNYDYAHEKNNQLLIGKNMVGILLETREQETVENVTKLTSREETIYPTTLPNAATGNLVLPLSEYSFDTLNSSQSYKDVSYDKYDENGNILQYTTKDGTPVSIVWGYKKTKPIAKIVGALYSQVEPLIADIVAKSDEDAVDPTKEAALLSAFESFNPLGHITTYTYDPLIGVTTITPPSGIRELYIYDTANRLKEIKARERDNAGNYVFKTLKEFKYNYKQ
ncbi:hypothetical protein [Chryseobacterium sp. c4a]|uniref:hypothetical protein n=1 Tax=Chryseobacterium sp. c4a TaxID=1573582 RepID=UPI001358126E|nr:hypothetical protein [Chryseobacterium sp. c4a]